MNQISEDVHEIQFKKKIQLKKTAVILCSLPVSAAALSKPAGVLKMHLVNFNR